MFLTSHFYGPFIGLAMALFLILLGFPLDLRLLGFTALVCLFWPYGFAVGRVSHLLLSLCSLQHLCFVILWSSYGYGGLASPFLLWLAVVPLLAFLYLSPNLRLWALLIAMIAVNTGVFAFLTLGSPPPAVDAGRLQWLALVSALCAAIYVSMMAVHFGHVLNSRDAVEKEMARHRETAASLDKQVGALKQAGSMKAGLLAGIGNRAQAPLSEIVEACEQLKRQLAVGEGLASADVRSITEATRYLVELVRDVDRYAGLDAADIQRDAAPCDLEGLLRNVARAAQAWPKPLRVDVDAAELPGLRTHAALLEEAVGHVLGHLAQQASSRPLKLHASRLPSETGDYVVIDLYRNHERQSASGTTAPPLAASVGMPGGSLRLAVAGRILSTLGGKLNPYSERDAGWHVRIELPVNVPA